MSTTARELCPTEDTEQICLFRWAAIILNTIQGVIYVQ